MTDRKAKAKVELPQGIKDLLSNTAKVEFIEGPALEAFNAKLVQLKEKKEMPKVWAISAAISEKMLKDINAAKGRVPLSTPSLVAGKETIRKTVKKDLLRIAKRKKLRYEVKVVEEGNDLVFFYVAKAEKKDKQDKAA